MQDIDVSWRPYLPTPRPALIGPDPVSLDVLRCARELCANFRTPPLRFRRRTATGEIGYYQVESDTVAVNPDRADMNGMGGDDGYYAVMVHELLHATGHPSRLDRATVGDYSSIGYALEEGTVLEARRIVLAEIGFDADAVEWYAPQDHGLPGERRAARAAALWLLACR